MNGFLRVDDADADGRETLMYKGTVDEVNDLISMT